ncbi:MAG: potassium-transporting ATPase subunit KdpA [Leptospiraceae bacterium]|nr:potassium-transporting ATPase subunit KdpA [Leptospiraceae bacterium]
MSERDYWQLAIYFAAVLILSPFIGKYVARVFQGEKTLFTPLLGWLERLIYRISGVKTETEMSWKQYTFALMVFNLLGFVVVFILQLFQSKLPLNPQKLPDVPLLLALNTAVSFMTNTNWQAYSGENTLSYLVQLIGLNVQNFLSAATGFAVLLAMVRGLISKGSTSLGNFWIDLTRATLYVLLPLSILFSLLLVTQGVVQSFNPYREVKTLEIQKDATGNGTEHEAKPALRIQQLPLGPAASQIAIKQLGTNGGGFFGVNSAHPFENPTPLSNFLQLLAILLLPIACVAMFGEMIGAKRHGYALLTAMFVIFFAGLAVMLYFEHRGNPVFGGLSNLEGKELRFGITNSVLWGAATTAASNGSVNAMHDSFQAIPGMVTLFNIMLGEVVFGGVGAGLYGMLTHVIITVFLAGLMVGRTPEYLGKKIEAKEVKLAMLAIVVPSAAILVGTAIAVLSPQAVLSLNNKGPHGLTEILYAFSSAAGNNGSAFAGLNANTDFYNIALAIAMFFGRFAVIIPVLAIGGSMAAKKTLPQSAGTFRTDTTVFIILLVAEIVIVGGLTFFPALTLGPIVEHYLVPAARLF